MWPCLYQESDLYLKYSCTFSMFANWFDAIFYLICKTILLSEKQRYIVKLNIDEIKSYPKLSQKIILMTKVI